MGYLKYRAQFTRYKLCQYNFVSVCLLTVPRINTKTYTIHLKIEQLQIKISFRFMRVTLMNIYMQLCLIRTDVDPKVLSGLGKIRIMHIGIICIGRDWDLPICPV